MHYIASNRVRREGIDDARTGGAWGEGAHRCEAVKAQDERFVPPRQQQRERTGAEEHERSDEPHSKPRHVVRVRWRLVEQRGSWRQR